MTKNKLHHYINKFKKKKHIPIIFPFHFIPWNNNSILCQFNWWIKCIIKVILLSNLIINNKKLKSYYPNHPFPSILLIIKKLIFKIVIKYYIKFYNKILKAIPHHLLLHFYSGLKITLFCESKPEPHLHWNASFGRRYEPILHPLTVGPLPLTPPTSFPSTASSTWHEPITSFQWHPPPSAIRHYKPLDKLCY